MKYRKTAFHLLFLCSVFFKCLSFHNEIVFPSWDCIERRNWVTYFKAFHLLILFTTATLERFDWPERWIEQKLRISDEQWWIRTFPSIEIHTATVSSVLPLPLWQHRTCKDCHRQAYCGHGKWQRNVSAGKANCFRIWINISINFPLQLRIGKDNDSLHSR